MGRWKIFSNGNSWRCEYVSKSAVNCEGRTLTLKGNTVAWESGGDIGTIRKSGTNDYDTIAWSYNNWIEQGDCDMNNILIPQLQIF